MFVGIDDEECNGNDPETPNANKAKSGNLKRPIHLKTESNEDKLKIINVAKDVGNSKTARLFNVKRQNIIRWRKQENEIKIAIANKKGKKTILEKPLVRLNIQ